MKKHFSRIFAVLLVVSMLCTQLLVPVSAEGTTSECTCAVQDVANGTLVDTYEANCIYYGYEKYTCNVCQGTFRVFTDEPTGIHDTVYHAAKAPTCTAFGWDAYETCKVCDYNADYLDIEANRIPALGHAMKAIPAQEATCTQKGWTEHEACTRCSYKVGYTEMKKLPHTPGEEVFIEDNKEPTCDKAGSYKEVKYCTVCGGKASTKTITVPALGHDMQAVTIVAPECMVKDGYIDYKCSRCPKTDRETLKKPTEHDYRVTEVSATCTEAGTRVHTCTVCGKVGVVENLPALGHDIIKHEAKAPTCTEIGWEAYETCSRCDYTTYEELPALGHEATGVTKVTAATCVDGGFTWNECSRCADGFITDETQVDPLAHYDYYEVTKEHLDPTCVADGHTEELSCPGCKVVLRASEVIPALTPNKKHNYDKTLGIVPNTCTEDGYTTKQCVVCGEIVNTDIVEAPGHVIVEHEAKAVTCLEDGWDAYETCAVCDYTTFELIVTDGHDLVHHDAQAATCTEIGWDAYDTCEDCDYTTYVEIPATRHQMRYHADKAPTCDDFGWSGAMSCVKCGHTIYELLPALGHDLIDHEAKVPCVEEGWNAYQTCSRCDYSTQKVLPVIGSHDMVEDKGYMPTYDSDGLSDGSHCARCGWVEVPQIVIEAYKESVTFSYEATGINNSDVIVNSGYAYVNIYMNVNDVYADTTDIARIWGVNLNMKYDAANFELISVDAAKDLFAQSLSTPGAEGYVVISQDMNLGEAKTFEEGKHLFATLKFKVNANYYAKDAAFEIVEAESKVARDFYNTLDVDFGTGVVAHIDMLGDTNGDMTIDSDDSMALSKWFADAEEGEYNAIFDMNKDGYINGDDFALIRGAVVRDNTYLLVG